jgi:hypothetical protein
MFAFCGHGHVIFERRRRRRRKKKGMQDEE